MKLRILLLTLLILSALAPAQTPQIPPERHFGPELTFTPQKRDVWPDERIRPIALPDGRLLLSRFGTVYMLDVSGKQLWKYETDGETLTSEPAYNTETNEIGVVGYDLLFVRLDATTGEEKWRAKTVGGATFINVAAYGHGFLVVVDMTAYREKDKEFKDPHIKGMEPDRLEYWGQTEDDEWIADFPIGAQLLVNGKHIYAVRRIRSELRLRELQPTSGQRR
ncbi:MAG: PQQ-binding-like beta-propeller repeat protein [Terracidiphilus sp.]|jgi:hypothetical protein